MSLKVLFVVVLSNAGGYLADVCGRTMEPVEVWYRKKEGERFYGCFVVHGI